MQEKNQTIKDDDRVREYLANERTYLAWMRTGIATMGFGVVIARLRYLFGGFQTDTSLSLASGLAHASNIGLLFTGIGLLTVILSAWHFLTIQKQIREQRYHSSKTLIVVFSSVVIVLGICILWYLAKGTKA